MHRFILALLMSCLTSLAVAAEPSDRPGTDAAAALGLTNTNTAPSSATSPTQAPRKDPRAQASAPAPGTRTSAAGAPPTPFNYTDNPSSDAFGARLFSGTFAREGATQFNPDYAVATGDNIQIRLWGAFDFDATLTVDPQGSIFLPHIGPVKVLGVRNQELQTVVESAVRRVYRANVYSYVSLAAAQPVNIFVSGFVRRPGLYAGTSMDSLLHYLDQAGGIDPDRGSFLEVQVKRSGQIRGSVNLYDFLLHGRIPPIQLATGDVIFVTPRKNTVKVSGLVENANTFEFAPQKFGMSDLLPLARPNAQATHVRVVRNQGTVKNSEYYALTQVAQVSLSDGDEIEFTADKKPGTITVRVEGEHLSPQEYVLPYGTRLGTLLKDISFTELSDEKSIQLFRQSVRERQRMMLQTALKSLEASVLTARSGTSDEARLRQEEADLILKWVDRAKQIETSGQVLIAQATQRDQLLLENGDVLKIPTRDDLVLISGEVLFPNAIAHDPKLELAGYIRAAGGYAQNADTSRLVIAHRDGSFGEATESSNVRAGDEILVLPKIDVKSRQIWKDMTQILYQIAVSAKVVLGL